ncbi:MAG: hypothetical protein ACJAYU_003300 [Bradymonadia bacterium]|jgi:hypothetical protein
MRKSLVAVAIVALAAGVWFARPTAEPEQGVATNAASDPESEFVPADLSRSGETDEPNEALAPTNTVVTGDPSAPEAEVLEELNVPLPEDGVAYRSALQVSLRAEVEDEE